MNRFKVILINDSRLEVEVYADFMSVDNGTLIFGNREEEVWDEAPTVLVRAFAPGTWKEVKKIS